MLKQIVRRHTPAIVFLLSFCATSVIQRAAAQSPSSDARQKMEASVSRQTAAVTAMMSSIGRQTESVRRQLSDGSSAAGGFFTLPAPARVPMRLVVQPECGALPPAQVDTLVSKASTREGVAPALIRSVMKEESGFRPCAVSPKGAVGLMQLMPETAADLEVKDPFNPQDNVAAGTKLLRQLLEHYDGDLSLTLGAYNAGPSRVDAEGAIPAFPETTNYVQRILSMLPIEQMRDLSFDAATGP